MKVKEIKVWFTDDSYMSVNGSWAENARLELTRYSSQGFPLFIEMGEGLFYAASTVYTYQVVEEVTNG